MNLIKYKNKNYPKFQTEGFSAQYCFPFATKFCQGNGLDIGCSKKEWALPNAMPIDITFEDDYDALNLPDGSYDYIFSSHCLEHILDWPSVLDYWISKLKEGGTLFLYLPDYSQEYWRPWNCRKHCHTFTSQIIVDFLKDRKMNNIFFSGVDLNNSFTVVCEK